MPAGTVYFLYQSYPSSSPIICKALARSRFAHTSTVPAPSAAPRRPCGSPHEAPPRTAGMPAAHPPLPVICRCACSLAGPHPAAPCLALSARSSPPCRGGARPCFLFRRPPPPLSPLTAPPLHPPSPVPARHTCVSDPSPSPCLLASDERRLPPLVCLLAPPAPPTRVCSPRQLAPALPARPPRPPPPPTPKSGNRQVLLCACCFIVFAVTRHPSDTCAWAVAVCV